MDPSSNPNIKYNLRDISSLEDLGNMLDTKDFEMKVSYGSRTFILKDSNGTEYHVQMKQIVSKFQELAKTPNTNKESLGRVHDNIVALDFTGDVLLSEKGYGSMLVRDIKNYANVFFTPHLEKMKGSLELIRPLDNTSELHHNIIGLLNVWDDPSDTLEQAKNILKKNGLNDEIKNTIRLIVEHNPRDGLNVSSTFRDAAKALNLSGGEVKFFEQMVQKSRMQTPEIRELDIENLKIKSKNIKEKINNFRTECKAPSDTNSLKALKIPDQKIIQAVANTKMLVPNGVKQLASDFLDMKRREGSNTEKALYKDMTTDAFLDRLMSKRPLAFFNPGDTYLLKDGTSQGSGTEEFDAVGSDSQLSGVSLSDCLSYDEMQISAFLGFATPTYFINDGNRNNLGKPAEKGTFIEEGVYAGLVGARFERKGHMEDEHMIVREGIRNESKDKIWAEFYGIEKFPTLDDVKQNPDRFIQIRPGEYLDKQVYKAGMKKRLESFMANAATQGTKTKPAYLHLVSLGLGVWAPQKAKSELSQIQYEAYVEIIKSGDFKHVCDMDFSFFNFKSKEKPEFIEDKNGHQIRLHFTKNDPAQITEAKKNKQLVAQFAWDGNSFPGNEYWMGQQYFSASGDPAAATCSTIIDTYVAKFT